MQKQLTPLRQVSHRVSVRQELSAMNRWQTIRKQAQIRTAEFCAVEEQLPRQVRRSWHTGQYQELCADNAPSFWLWQVLYEHQQLCRCIGAG